MYCVYLDAASHTGLPYLIAISPMGGRAIFVLLYGVGANASLRCNEDYRSLQKLKAKIT